MAEGLTDSKWRKAENVYYLEDLQEVPETALEEAVTAFTAAEQPPPTQVLLPPPEATKELGKVGDYGRGVEVAKGKEARQNRAQSENKGKGKEATLKAKEFDSAKPQAVA